MSRNNPELESLRKQVLARQRAAGKKISRLKGKGVKIGGTQHDPRRPVENISRYNAHQLRIHLGRLNAFTDRRTRFTADAHGKPLPYSQFQVYKQAERKMNAAKKKVLDKIGNIVAPGAGGVTINERMKIVTPDRPRAGNPAANPFTFVERKSTAFKNEKALAKLTKHMLKQLSSDFLAKDLTKDREVAADMLKTLRQPKMQQALDKLSDFHFNILWNFTSFATDVSYPYELAKQLLKGEGEAWHREKLNENISNAYDLINETAKIQNPGK